VPRFEHITSDTFKVNIEQCLDLKQVRLIHSK